MTNVAGYSGKPLFQKLGMKPGMTCRVIRPPADYADLVAGVSDVKISSRVRNAEIVHMFCRTELDLGRDLTKALGAVGEGGALWVSWPKKSSPLHRDLTEDGIRRLVLPSGWVDVKVCAVDADWSGLKFLKRRRNA